MEDNNTVAASKKNNDTNSHMREVFAGSKISLGARLVGIILSVLLNIIIARVLGADGAGTYFFSFTLIMTASTIGLIGLDGTTLRFASATFEDQKITLLKNLSKKIFTFTIISSTFLATILFVSSEQLSQFFFSSSKLTSTLQIMSPAVVLFTVLTIHNQLFKSIKKILRSQISELLGINILLIPTLYIMAKSWGVKGAALAYTLSVLVVTITAIYLWIKSLPPSGGKVEDFKTKDIFASGIPLFWSSITLLVMNSIATYFIGYFSSASDVAIYNLAFRMAAFTTLAILSVSTVLAPKLSALYSNNDIEALREVTLKSRKLMVLLAIPILSIFLLFPKFIMGLFGPSFIEGSSILIILAIGQFINVALGPTAQLLVMTGHERSILKLYSLCAIISILLNFILIKHYGIIGAAIATALTLTIKNVCGAIIVSKKLNIRLL